MLKLKTKWFNKWAKKNSLSDKILLKTISNITNNLGAVNIGSGLYKVRTPKIGKGKSGGFRTIVVFKKFNLAIFVYGFSKSEKENLDKEELKYFKTFAKDLLKIDKQKFIELEMLGKFISLKE